MLKEIECHKTIVYLFNINDIPILQLNMNQIKYIQVCLMFMKKKVEVVKNEILILYRL